MTAAFASTIPIMRSFWTILLLVAAVIAIGSVSRIGPWGLGTAALLLVAISGLWLEVE